MFLVFKILTHTCSTFKDSLSTGMRCERLLYFDSVAEENCLIIKKIWGIWRPKIKFVGRKRY